MSLDNQNHEYQEEEIVRKKKKVKSPNKVHECSWCDIEFDKYFRLKKHIKTAHPEMYQKSNKVIRCDVCHKLYSSEISLERHKRRMHEGIKIEKTKNNATKQ